MAQPVIEEGPLEQYLRDVGDIPLDQYMPGAHPSLIQEPESFEEDMEWRPRCLVLGLNLLETFLTSTRPKSPTNPFVERFKYNVISSSLLSTSLPSSQIATPASRSSFASSTSASIPAQLQHDQQLYDPKHKHQHPYPYLSIAALATALLLSIGCGTRWIASLSLGGLSYLAYRALVTNDIPLYDHTHTIDALDALVEANCAWESNVHDSLAAIEKEEATLLRSPSSAPSPQTSALRSTLHSTLTTTRTQCDNVRQLFSALTCPAELAQLSEMYAPPSPVKSPLFLPNETPRPHSYPTYRDRGLSPTTPEAKRATWNGSYTSPSTMRRRDKKHLSTLSPPSHHSAPSSAASGSPITPSAMSPVLGPSFAQVAESLHKDDEHEQFLDYSDDQHVFGSAALDLHKRRKMEGLGTFELPPPATNTHFTSPDFRRHRSPNRQSQHAQRRAPSQQRHSAFVTPTRFSTQQASRHPLSMYALNQALQSAVASRRYTCSHLLALRFQSSASNSFFKPMYDNGGLNYETREEEEEYWLNVQNVIELLTTTFTDEAARLHEALEDVEKQHLREMIPTPDITGEFQRRRSAIHARTPSGLSASSGSFALDSRRHSASGNSGNNANDVFSLLGNSKASTRRLSNLSGGIGSGFAPMPSHLSQFAAHVAAINAALDDAREQLEECVRSLKDDPSLVPGSRSNGGGHKRSSSEDEDGEVGLGYDEEEHKALQAYERLRKELGLALRECERGRPKLVEVVDPPAAPQEDDDATLLDSSNEASPPRPPPKSCDDDSNDLSSNHHQTAELLELNPSEATPDDVTSHLLLSASHPDFPPSIPVGVEQVYEADTSLLTPFVRERSKLSREDRIRLMKARRESAISSGIPISAIGFGSPDASTSDGEGIGRNSGRGGKTERWGPSGEVVQELKDVIWKVSEKRRKMGVQQAQQQEQEQEQQWSASIEPVSPVPQRPLQPRSSLSAMIQAASREEQGHDTFVWPPS